MLGAQKFLPLTGSLLVFAARDCGHIFPGTGTLGWGAWCGSRTPHSYNIPSKSLYTIHGCGTSLFHICIPPSSLMDVFLQFRSCQTSIPLYFWQFWLVVVPYFSCNFDEVVQRGEPCMPLPSTWPEVSANNFNLCVDVDDSSELLEWFLKTE